MFRYGDFVKIKERGSQNESSYWLVIEEQNGAPSKLLAAGPTYEAMRKVFKDKRTLMSKTIQQITPDWLSTKQYTVMLIHKENVENMLRACAEADLVDKRFVSAYYVDTIIEREEYTMLLMEALIKSEKYEALASSFVKNKPEKEIDEDQKEFE